MRKHTLYGIWHKIGDLSLFTLLVRFFLSVAISIFALRDNNMKMSKLREALYTADERNGDVETALTNLRVFVYGHMNTDLRAGSSSSQPPIQLVNKFNKAVEAERAKYAALGGTNKVYADAQATCEKPYIPLVLPPKEDYTFDFIGPRWSPDLAGWALVATVVIALFIMVRLIIGIIIKRSLRY